MEWSHYQKAVFEEAAKGSGHVIILARAGSGKTTTIVEAMKYVPKGKRVLFCSYNKRIQESLQARVPKGVMAKTFHSLGFTTLRNQWGDMEVDKDRLLPLIKEALPETYRKFGLYANEWHMRKDEYAMKRLVSLAKNCLLDSVDDIIDCAEEHDLFSTNLDSMMLATGALSVLKECRNRTTIIDYDDQVWLPIVHNLPFSTYDVVFVDEVQDLNPCQTAIVQRCCKPNGRIIAVGDDRQAIYQFNGAATDGVHALADLLKAKILPLSISYRCPRAVVELAQEVVADIESAPEAIEGEVKEANADDLLHNITQNDSFVLSRTNAGAVEVCLALLRGGKRAYVVGRDLGQSIKILVERSKATTVEQLKTWAYNWYTSGVFRIDEESRRHRRSPEAALARHTDRYYTLVTVAGACASIQEVQNKFDSLFGNEGESQGRIACSTIHKAKGLEAEQVWILRDTFTFGDSLVETNVWYVGITRSKNQLFLTDYGVRQVKAPRKHSH